MMTQAKTQWIARLGALVLLGFGGKAAFTEPPLPQASPQAIEFFEKKIRPVLVERCYPCHSAQAPKAQGGLLLDSREGMLKGGNTGPGLVPGDPEKSLIIKAIRYQTPELQMPPGTALSPAEVADFEAWIKMGAPDPRSQSAKTIPATDSAKLKHWAFQPPRHSPAPPIKNKVWARNPIDEYILAGLESKGLTPNPAADKRTLIRRATFDLIGLPPTVQESEAFLADNSPQAFVKVVDRLLASPHYGERWGRYWLDVARYADTKSGGSRFPFSYTYRDWVIRAFASDMPYDRFLMLQIAADRLPRTSAQIEDHRDLAALGFITLGRDFPKSPTEMIDDRIDVVTRGTLGLTVSCARCHDHKYDPIPTKDYYSLYGVFANTTEPEDPPLLGKERVKTAKDRAYEAAFKERRDTIDAYRRKRFEILKAELYTPEQLAAYMVGAAAARNLGNAELETFTRDQDLNLFLIRRWRDFLQQKLQSQDPDFAPWHALASLPEKEFASKCRTVLAPFLSGKTDKRVNPLVAEALAGPPPATLKEAAQRYASLTARYDKPAPLADPYQESLRLILRAADAPMNVSFSQLDQIETEGDRNNLVNQRTRVERLWVDYACRGSAPRAMALEDVPKPQAAHVFVRGNPNNSGAEVPRQFLSALSGENRQPFQNGSGRLDLARAIVSKDNPLTARVFVNRLWHYHFGAGIVRTPSDFGLRGEAPTHPELLDYLALRFMEEGWSIKKMHRLMMLSSVYQQSSRDNPQARTIDSENRLCWRMNRRRLDFEALRDGMLAVAGQLDRTQGGLPVSITCLPPTRRRTVYAFIDRAKMPGVLQTFDFASPDQHAPLRYQTTVPQQALFMMNSPFVGDQARHLIERPEVAAVKTAPARIQMLYRLVFGRKATLDEIELGQRFLQERPSQQQAAVPSSVWEYGVAEMDPVSGATKNFSHFRYFTEDSWQASPLLPDVSSGNARLTAEGGDPGADPNKAIVRRWMAPQDATLRITGTLSHVQGKYSKGDGIQAWIVSSRKGQLASWTLVGTEAETGLSGFELKKGDTLDFMVSGRKDSETDTFSWAPVIEVVTEGNKSNPEAVNRWSASLQFKGPDASPLNAWEQYAQVLLQTNEFAFLD